MIYHVTSEKYYQLDKPPEVQAPSLAQEIFLNYPFAESPHIEKWEFVPFLADSSTFCIEYTVRQQDEKSEQLLFTVDFSDTGAKATCYEPIPD
jgi:hypothetical protein